MAEIGSPFVPPVLWAAYNATEILRTNAYVGDYVVGGVWVIGLALLVLASLALLVFRLFWRSAPRSPSARVLRHWP